MKGNTTRGTLFWFCAVSATLPGLAHAGAAYIYEMSNASETGYGGAGMAGRANDAGTVFTNPAGMTRFDDQEIMAGGGLVYIYAPYRPNENNTVEGSNGQVKELVPLGSFSYVKPISDKLKFGISAQNNFGLALNWQDGWVGRYSATKVTLLAPQVQPTLAYKVNDWLSVGAGAAVTLGYLADRMRVKPLDPEHPDGKLRLSDQAWAVQGNLGIMIEPNDRLRIGIRYLTETDLDFRDAPQISGLGREVSTDDRLDLGITMPQSVMTGVHYNLNDKWNLLGSVGWDEWSEFGKVQVGVDGTGITTTVDEGFRDVWHFGVGAEHDYSPKWTFTGGFSYDTSLATDATTPLVLPLGAMYRYALGFKYKKRDDLTLGGGLTWMWEGNLSTKPTGGVEGHYSKVSLTFISFYARWH